MQTPRGLSRRARAVIGAASALFVLFFAFIWTFGQEISASEVAGEPKGIYPGVWPPAARGVLWLAAGAAAVTFDLLVARPLTETPRGRRAVGVFAAVTGTAFLIFAIGSFAATDWSIIH